MAPQLDRPLYIHEFPDFEPLEFQPSKLPIPFYDHSWHNDACPRFETNVPEEQDATISHLALWIDYADKSKSELGPDNPRFTLTYGKAYGEEEVEQLGTDSLEELTACLQGIKDGTVHIKTESEY